MLAEQSKNDELVANQLRFDIQARREPATNSVAATAGPPHEIKIDQSDRVSNSPAPGGGYTFYVALVAGLLATTCGLAWFILNESALPFDLRSVRSLTGNRDLFPKAISSGSEQSSNSPAARTPDTQKSDGIQIHDTIVHEGAAAEARQNPNVFSASTKSVSSTPLPGLASKDSTVAPRPEAWAGATVKDVRTLTKLTPTPETRPKTIEGWTLREVVNGTAVLAGPNGVWRVTRGQTVPGVGRVESIVRWGNRLIVATSSGLISTP